MTTATEDPKIYDWADENNAEQHHREFAPDTASTNHITLAPTQSSAGTNGLHSDKTSSNLRRTRSALGLHPDAPIDEDHDTAERQKLLWSRIRIILREPFAEFWGTCIMVMFGDGSVAQVMLSVGQTTAPGGAGFGAYQSISWG
jgi:aquaglyceroporin related protein